MKVLCQHIFPCCAVQAAGGGVEEARHPDLFSELGEADRGAVINCVRTLWIEISERVVR